ncbi:MAG: transcriptional regulator with XRE-family HTH domain [Hyphomicrobiaceae bacterium]|jgi:transcriptional regulator with XRE-family HTH domain
MVQSLASEPVNPRKSNPVDTYVGGRVRLRRMLLGMSQEKLGEKLGLTFQQVQKYEKGTNRIGASRLFELSRILGVSVQYFYEDLGGSADEANTVGGFAEPTGDDLLIEFLNSREGIELNRAYLRIDDSKSRRAILELVRSLADAKS